MLLVSSVLCKIDQILTAGITLKIVATSQQQQDATTPGRSVEASCGGTVVHGPADPPGVQARCIVAKSADSTHLPTLRPPNQSADPQDQTEDDRATEEEEEQEMRNLFAVDLRRRCQS